ncbi:unnamed protein product [Amaranthus hypochondriacus]
MFKHVNGQTKGKCIVEQREAPQQPQSAASSSRQTIYSPVSRRKHRQPLDLGINSPPTTAVILKNSFANLEQC